MKNLISVVVPVYNVSRYLDKCMDSIVNQTYTNLDIIIIDDGSTDDSGFICDRWKEKDNRITVIHQPNAGLSEARNAGISIAKGKFITFIDSDDYIAYDMLEYLIDLTDKDNAQIAICQYLNVDEENQPLNTESLPFNGVIHGNSECMKALFLNKSVNTVAWGKLYLTELFNDIKYPAAKYHEDVFTTYRLISRCETLVVGKERKYYYRWRQSGISKCIFSKNHLHSVEACIERSRFIENKYPDLIKYANATIIYASNICVLKYMNSCINDDEIVVFLQKQYRKYEKDFLSSDCRFLSKLFSVLAYFNLYFFVKTYRIIKKVDNA